MTYNEATAKARELWIKWVSTKPAVGLNGYLRETKDIQEYEFYNLDKIHESMLREARWHRTNPRAVTVGLISEVKGELILLGKIRKVLAQ